MNKKLYLLLLVPLLLSGCLFDDMPIDEDGLLITERAECYVSRLELLGADYQTVRAGIQGGSVDDLRKAKDAVIDTVACTINVEVKWGSDLKNIYPQFTLAQDCKLDPKITGLTDFSDLGHPRQYTVISGNRKIRKTYTIYITIQELLP
ncbi:MAG: hypothetical protein LBS25_01420 [Candidatus Symbiothrix sp.]|nr:hypothetical protein [Candidatus Symbiothrix sp.]